MIRRFLTMLAFLPFAAGGVHAADGVRKVAVRIFIAGPRAPRETCREMSDALTDVSRDFRAFGLRFEMSDCSPAPEFAPDEPVIRPILERFAPRSVPGGIAVLAASGSGPRHGLSDFRRGVSAISFEPSEGNGPRAILEHEIGHLFGAVHVSDVSSPMHPQAGRGGFDPSSRKRISLLRDRRFIDERMPVAEGTWRAYIDALSAIDDERLPRDQRDRSTMLVMALGALGRDEDARDELSGARTRGEATPELTLAGIQAELSGGGRDRAVHALSDLHALARLGVAVDAARAEAVAILLRSAEAEDRSGDFEARDADLALLETEAPGDAALSRASFSIAAGDPDGARAWLDLAGDAAESPFGAEIRCGAAIERNDPRASRCRCGAIDPLPDRLLRSWAELALRDGDYESAARAWGLWLLREPADSFARQAQALALLRSGDRAGALRALEQARSRGVEFTGDLEREIRSPTR
ncbi:MAG: hypothetical protein ACREFI_16625 [Stellaceae bacterium]